MSRDWRWLGLLSIMVRCPGCSGLLAPDDEECPHCGRSLPRELMDELATRAKRKNWLSAVFGVCAFLIIAYAFLNGVGA